jgi:hypothetical protein
MARLLYPQDSTAAHSRLIRRHIRLCGQVKGGATFAQAIQPVLDNLLQKKQALAVAEEVSENAYDDLILKDSYLGDAVRTLFERSRQYDRENGTAVSVLLFPDLTFSDIINLPYSEKPKKVGDIIRKMGTLDPKHELHPLIETLQQKVDAVNSALDTRRQAADNVRKCHVDIDLAKNAIRKRYEDNYLESRKSLGKYVAESLFPKVARRKAKSAEEDVEPTTEE